MTTAENKALLVEQALAIFPFEMLLKIHQDRELTHKQPRASGQGWERVYYTDSYLRWLIKCLAQGAVEHGSMSMCYMWVTFREPQGKRLQLTIEMRKPDKNVLFTFKYPSDEQEPNHPTATRSGN